MANLLEVRTRELEPGLFDRWLWLKSDTGAWSGPFTDWAQSHREKYFEHVKKYDVVVTAGANCGAYVRAYAKRFKTVYAFEPEYLCFYCMCYNNPEENVKKFNAALGEECGMCNINNSNKSNIGMTTVKFDKDGNGTTAMLTIDCLNLPACDLIQLDVEGYEEHAINGALKTIEKYRPVIICERNNPPLTKLLESLNYTHVGASKADQIYKPN